MRKARYSILLAIAVWIPLSCGDFNQESPYLMFQIASMGDGGGSSSSNAIDSGSAVILSKSDVAVTEGGSQDSYTIHLGAAPTSDVTVTISPDSQLMVNGSSESIDFTFSPDAFDVEQTVTISALDDGSIEGNHTGNILHSISSSDENYNGIGVNYVKASIVDNDSAGVSISPTSGSATEGLTGTSYEVVLTSEPMADVIINISPDSQCTTDKASLLFTAGGSLAWNIPRTVTVEPVDDAVEEAPHLPSTVTHTVTSQDEDYQSIGSVASFTLNITDNDTPDVSVTVTDNTCSEGGGKASYEVVILSEPTSSVVVDISPGPQVTTDHASLTFTDGDWGTAQTVQVTCVNDSKYETSPLYETITHSIHATSAAEYVGLSVDSVTLEITDNDLPHVSMDKTSVVVNENGTKDTFLVTLDTQPTSGNVVIDLATDNAEVEIDDGGGWSTTGQITLNSSSWNTGKTVKVRLVDNDVDDGNRNHTIDLDINSGLTTTPEYDASTGMDNSGVINVSAQDDDTHAVTLSTTSLSVLEEGTPKTYTVVLDSEPTSTVTITMTGSGDLNLTESETNCTNPSTHVVVCTFTASDWDSARTVSVAEPDDGDTANDVDSITFSISGGDYAGLTAGPITVNVNDNDIKGIYVNPTSVTLDEAAVGSTKDFDVVLTALPTGDVTIRMDPDDGQITLNHNSGAGCTYSGDAVECTFTTGNWSTTRTITITVVDDATSEGNHSVSVINTISASADSDYSAMNPDDISASIADNDAKRIFITSGSWTGKSLGGVSGADSKCLNDSSNPEGAGNGSWKALITDFDNRYWNSGASFADWPLLANWVYVRPDGTVIGTTTSNLVFSFGLTHSFSSSSNDTWTGMNTDFTTAIGSDPLKNYKKNCLLWSGTLSGAVGVYGQSNKTDSNSIHFGEGSCDTGNRRLICVEQ